MEEIIYCTFEMYLILFPVNESTKLEIERCKAWRGSKSINVSGEYFREIRLCVD